MDERPYVLTKKQRRYQSFKRGADFVVALAALVLLLIPFGIIAAVQKLTAPKEAVFFTQERYGYHGQIFRIIKFRSMVNTGQEMTAFGRFLRNSSIDELPQLLHVLTGKMSLIGPRPLVPEEEEMHRMRLDNGIYQLRPGITGWAQVNGRDQVTNCEKIKFDRQYLEQFGMNIDWITAWKTLSVVIRQEGL